MLFSEGVGLTKDLTYPLKALNLLKQHGYIQGKQRAMNQRPWMKQCCVWGERKVSLFHTHTGHHQFPPLFQPKRKNGNVRKRENPHPNKLIKLS